MQRRRAMFPQRREMPGAAIALVAFPAIMGMRRRRLHHHPVARLLRQDGCRRDGQAFGVALDDRGRRPAPLRRSEEHTSELQSLMRISYAVFCLKKKKTQTANHQYKNII